MPEASVRAGETCAGRSTKVRTRNRERTAVSSFCGLSSLVWLVVQNGPHVSTSLQLSMIQSVDNATHPTVFLPIPATIFCDLTFQQPHPSATKTNKSHLASFIDDLNCRKSGTPKSIYHQYRQQKSMSRISRISVTGRASCGVRHADWEACFKSAPPLMFVINDKTTMGQTSMY